MSEPKEPLVYIVSGDSLYNRMYLKAGWGLAFTPLEADLIQFTGGADVTPSLYGERKHATTQCDPQRDKREMVLYAQAVKHGIPMVGICRGAQFLNVMNGGKMWQDVDNHAISHTHEVLDHFSGEGYQVTSTHHQMMNPNYDEAVIIATAQETSFTEHMDGEMAHCIRYPRGTNMDTEVVFYPKTNCLCFQPHPEYGGSPEMTRKFFEYIDMFTHNSQDWVGETCAA